LRGLSRLKESTNSEVILEKLDEVTNMINHANPKSLDDAGIVKFMHMTQLYHELENNNE
jgi:hypothetical protein